MQTATVTPAASIHSAVYAEMAVLLVIGPIMGHIMRTGRPLGETRQG